MESAHFIWRKSCTTGNRNKRMKKNAIAFTNTIDSSGTDAATGTTGGNSSTTGSGNLIQQQRLPRGGHCYRHTPAATTTPAGGRLFVFVGVFVLLLSGWQDSPNTNAAVHAYSLTPSQAPTIGSTEEPTKSPTVSPSGTPTKSPTSLPTSQAPVVDPTAASAPPTFSASQTPSITSVTTSNPTSYPSWSSSSPTSSPTEVQFSFPETQQQIPPGIGFVTIDIRATVSLSGMGSPRSVTPSDHEKIAALLEPTLAQNLYESVFVGVDRLKITSITSMGGSGGTGGDDQMKVEFEIALKSPCTEDICGDYVEGIPSAYANLVVESLKDEFLVENIQKAAAEQQVSSLLNAGVAAESYSSEVADFNVIHASEAPSMEPSVTFSTAPSLSIQPSAIASVNPTLECRDSETKKFIINEDTGERKGCPWVARRKTTWRCEIPGVKELCPKTCFGTCSQSPSEAPSGIPSDVPTESCIDSSLRFWNVKSNSLKSCVWVARKETWVRCKIPGVSAHCPNTCGQCEAYKCEDSAVKFKVEKESTTVRSCDYFGNLANFKRVLQLCRREEFMNTCRNVCGLCSSLPIENVP